MNNKAWIAVVVVAFVAAFGGGIWYGRLPAPSSQAPAPTQNAAPTGVTSVFGQVTAKSNSSITLKLLDGTTQTILVDTTTLITAVPPPTTLSDISVGETISAVVPTGGSGNPTAQSINIVPPPPAP